MLKFVFFILISFPVYVLALESELSLDNEDSTLDLIYNSETGVSALELASSKSPKVTNITELANPERLVIYVEDIALEHGLVKKMEQIPYLKLLRIHSVDSKTRITLELQGLSWPPYSWESKGDTVNISFGEVRETKSEFVKVKKTEKKEKEVLETKDIEEEKESELEKEIEKEIEKEKEAEEEIEAKVAEVKNEEEKEEVDTQQLLAIKFIKDEDKSYFLNLEFNALPQFELAKKKKNYYLLTVDDFQTENEKLLLPYFAPSTFQGLKYVQTELDDEDINIKLQIEKDFRLVAVPNENNIEIRAEKIS